jgi:hypothetical protein
VAPDDPVVARLLFRLTKPLYRAVVQRLPLKQKRAMLYFRVHRRFPRLRDPRTFNEKVNWRVVNDRRPVIGLMGDKLAMKDYAAQVCPDLAIPRVVWSGTDVGELAGVELPEHWVIKPNHRAYNVHFGSGRPDVEELRRVTDGWLEETLFKENCQWAYSVARRVLLVEEFLGTPGQAPADYKFYVFRGQVALIQSDVGRFSADHRRQYLTPDWTMIASHGGADDDRTPLPAPASLPEMTAIASVLGREFDFIRVDLYDIDGTIWFGELTPYPGAGLDPDEPEGWDERLGRLWTLPPLDEVRPVRVG